MSWLTRARKGINLFNRPETGNGKPSPRPDIPENLWNKCPSCGDLCYHKELAGNLWVCYQCGYHYPVDAETYFELLFDDGAYEETHHGVVSLDPLDFRDSKRYKDRLREARARTGRDDAVMTGVGRIDGMPVALAVMDFKFMGGSMGSAVGEKIARCIKDAITNRVPLVIVSRSGGARMQESLLSLMQLGKTAAMLARLADDGLPFVSVLTHPTTGGVTASFAMLGDVNYAEPQALIGFAGPRVIKQTINTDLPDGFQSSEFLLEHGMVDRIVARRDLKREIAEFLRFAWKDAASHPDTRPPGTKADDEPTPALPPRS